MLQNSTEAIVARLEADWPEWQVWFVHHAVVGPVSTDATLVYGGARWLAPTTPSARPPMRPNISSAAPPKHGAMAVTG